MSLNLGLESLRKSARVVKFTPASAIEMTNISDTITNLMTSLENFYDTARNAMIVKKTIKKYGKTQSLVALVGQEGLAAAQSFSMEGVWQKIKDFLTKIWEKIKEWWGRFWGMFFSIENKLSSFMSSLNGKKLAHAVEFDGYSQAELSDDAKKVEASISVMQAAVNDLESAKSYNNLVSTLAMFDQNKDGSKVADNTSYSVIHYKLTGVASVKAVADALYKIVKDYKQKKKNIDDYVDKALKSVKEMKTSTDKFTSTNGGTTYTKSEVVGASSTDEQDTAVKVIKTAAKLNNKHISVLVRATTSVAAKLMAHTKLVD